LVALRKAWTERDSLHHQGIKNTHPAFP
jgi:hypothetical protein